MSTYNESFNFDLSDPEALGILPEGEYTLRLVSVENTTSKAGNPMVVWGFVASVGGKDTETIRHYTAITPKAMFKVLEVLAAFGLGKPGEKVSFTARDVVGKTCSATIVHEEYNGQLRPVIAKLRPTKNVQVQVQVQVKDLSEYMDTDDGPVEEDEPAKPISKSASKPASKSASKSASKPTKKSKVVVEDEESDEE